MNSLDLIATARASIAATSGKPSGACLRRATSTAYYAVFHCLARDCADQFIGRQKALRSEPAWNQMYRALDHSQAKTQCQKAQSKNFPPEIKIFAAAFAGLQVKRHDADYNPHARFYKSSVLSDVDWAETAITSLKRVGNKDRRAFCAWVLLRSRS